MCRTLGACDPCPLSRMGRTASGHVHVSVRVNVYKCAFGRPRQHGTFAGTCGCLEFAPLSRSVARPRASPERPMHGCSNACSPARHTHRIDRREVAAGQPAVAGLTTHRLPRLALAHTSSQMFRYRCITVEVGSDITKPPVSPKTKGTKGFACGGTGGI